MPVEEIVRRTKEKAVFETFEKGQDVLITTDMLLKEVKAYRVERNKEEEQRPRRMGFAQPHEVERK